MFSCELCEISKNTFFHRTPLPAASAQTNFYILFWKNLMSKKQIRDKNLIYKNLIFEVVLVINKIIFSNFQWDNAIFENFSRKNQKQPPEVLAAPANLLKKRLWHRCFPVNFVKFLRTPFSQNTSGRLLLKNFFMRKKSM